MSTSNNPYFSVWFRPSETIERVLLKEVSFKSHIPIILAGLSAFIGDWNKVSPFVSALLVILIGTALTYFVVGHFFPWLLIKTGKIWNGKSGVKSLQMVVGLAQIPVLLILAVQLIALPLGNIKSSEEVNFLIQFVSWIFCLRILIIGISKAQEFTYGLAILNVVISVLPFLVLRLITI